MCPLREEAREKSVCRYVNVAASPTNKAKAEAEAGRTRWTGRSSVYAKGKALSCSYVATPRSRSHRAIEIASRAGFDVFLRYLEVSYLYLRLRTRTQS